MHFFTSLHGLSQPFPDLIDDLFSVGFELVGMTRLGRWLGLGGYDTGISALGFRMYGPEGRRLMDESMWRNDVL